jgi:FAD synthetase
MTFDGIAKSFNDKTSHNDTLVRYAESFFKVKKGKLNEGQLKLTCIPTTAKLNYPSPKSYANTSKEVSLSYPVSSVENVFVLPGIPALLRKGFDNIVCEIVDHSELKSFTKEIYLLKSELEIVSQLNRLVQKYKNDVIFGSYPKYTHNYYKTRLTVEAKSELQANKVCSEIMTMMASIDFDPNPQVDALKKINRLINNNRDRELQSLIKEALGTIEKSFKDYDKDQLMIAMNGGKDCLVMLHLVHAYVQQQNKANSTNYKLKCLCVQEKSSFPELSQFVKDSAAIYDLDIVYLDGPMKLSLQKIINDDTLKWKNEKGELCQILASFMGTRRTDPGCSNIEFFSPTDIGWPEMMRINPIINWKYHDIWTFIRSLHLQYPILYDQGYTSIGNTHNTKPNPYLLQKDGNGKNFYLPAYTLESSAWERAGRD